MLNKETTQLWNLYRHIVILVMRPSHVKKLNKTNNSKITTNLKIPTLSTCSNFPQHFKILKEITFRHTETERPLVANTPTIMISHKDVSENVVRL